MRKRPSHLPESKQAELKRIVSVIASRCDDVEMIILFGSYARGDYKEKADLKPNRKSGHVSDYDVLVVTGKKATATTTRLWRNITKECDKAGLSAHVRIVTHDIQELNIKLAEGQYFYTDIKKEGYLLYDSGNFKFARKRRLNLAEKKRIAQDHFDYWYKTATMSFDDFRHDFKKGAVDKDFYRKAAFNLHQATEHAYKTILLVFTNYNPNEHFLELLGRMASQHHHYVSEVFHRETEKSQKRFKLLDYAYIGARYDPAYRISRDDLDWLSERVAFLLELTERICQAKIRSFTRR